MGFKLLKLLVTYELGLEQVNTKCDNTASNEIKL